MRRAFAGLFVCVFASPVLAQQAAQQAAQPTYPNRPITIVLPSGIPTRLCADRLANTGALTFSEIGTVVPVKLGTNILHAD